MALIRYLLTLLIYQLHPRFPPAFDLSTDVAHPPCRIFSRPAFSQDGCGACVAYAVSTAHAMRECLQRGVDTIPSPHWLFDCAGGRCSQGSVVGQVVDVLGRGVPDVDKGAEFNCSSEIISFEPRRLSLFIIDNSDESLLKTELFVYHNPVLAVIQPDRDMALYPYRRIYDTEGMEELLRAQFTDGEWASVLKTRPHPLPVYHITGPPLLPHMVVVLGWGSEPEPHWVVQNSWGDEWGDNGRGKIATADLVDTLVLDARGWGDVWLTFFAYAVMLAVVLVVDVVLWWRGGKVAKEKDEDESV